MSSALATSTPLRGIELRTSGVKLCVPTSLHSSKQQVDVVLKAHVASIYFKRFRRMLQVFHLHAVVSESSPNVGFGVDDHLIRGLMSFTKMISREFF
jgi:hypothetical protein